ncbi:hypothetical protein [Streptomyces sp. JJ36]|uniref:hypothetical protein n=1 Tax=Streptomyces sp. JJ36 TaxID=2736645 RepID=UPI001F3C32CD|nr:hypothetical protein [Streptomyces sp. JJ36]MCF6526280.1 hypothetical protein [Streptomyces sp. JJ36]
MTARTATVAGSARTRSPYRPHRPRGMTWVVLRTHRTALWCWTAAVGAGTAGMLWLYALGEEAQRANEPCNPAGVLPCELSSEAITSYTWAASGASTVLAWLPLAVAVFAGGALIGRELESGTAALAWTQSVPPWRWLAVRLGVAALLLTAGTALSTGLFRWVWSAGDEHLRPDWYLADTYRALGPVTVAYVLLALAVGALAGLLLRRALPAMAVSLAVLLLVHLAADRHRSALWPTTTLHGRNALDVPADAWQLETGLVAGTGERLGAGRSSCWGADTAEEARRCLERERLDDAYAVVHPTAHQWPLQLVETAIVLGLAALVAGAAFVVLRRRLP